MKTEITYNVCRGNLGDDTTDAQYGAFKKAVESTIERAFEGDEYGEVVVYVGDSDFCNASTCNISIYDEENECDQFKIITREDVEEAASNVDESWWDAA